MLVSDKVSNEDAIINDEEQLLDELWGEDSDNDEYDATNNGLQDKDSITNIEMGSEDANKIEIFSEPARLSQKDYSEDIIPKKNYKDKPKYNDNSLNAVAESELQTVKKIESGPSESELRRRMLIEIDQDEMEEKIERLNKASLRNIAGCTGLSKDEQHKKLRECRVFLAKHLSSKDFAEAVHTSIAKHNLHIYLEAVPLVDAIEYLQSPEADYSSDEESKPRTFAEKNGSTDGLIALSDSEDESSDEEIVVPKVEVEKVVEQNSKSITFIRSNRAKSSRSALLTALRQKVYETANSNYCYQNKIQSEHLTVRLEIAEKTRMLIELLKERQERRSVQERLSRRARYQKLAGADDEEFNTDDEDDSFDQFNDGQFLSAEERDQLMRQLQEESNEMDEEDEAENVDEDGDWDRDGDVDQGDDARDEDTVAMTADKEESDDLQNSTIAIQDNLDQEVEDVRRLESDQVESTDSLTVHDISSLASKPDLEDEDDLVLTYGRNRNIAKAYDADASVANDSNNQLSDDDSERVAVEPTAVVKPKAQSRTGNAMFRLQMEAEERKARSQKKSGLLDDEAEEDEEEGMQAGLGDFGFGVMSDLKEMDDEKRALQFRKGDFDHIVDEVSDGEGDEEAAVQARIDMEIREDKERTRAVISAVTEGRAAGNKRGGKNGKYSFERLVGDPKRVQTEDGEQQGDEEEELDEEELLQRGLVDKAQREKLYRRSNNSDSEDTQSDNEFEDVDGDFELQNTDHMTESERLEEQSRVERQREQYRIENEKRRFLEKHCKMRRELRRQQANTTGQVAARVPATFEPLLTLSETLGPVESSVAKLQQQQQQQQEEVGIKRRTSMLPKKTPHGKFGLSRAKTVSGAGTTAVGQRLHYQGELSKAHISLGMGMAVQAAPVSTIPNNRQNKDLSDGIKQNNGLFSAVTGGIKRGASDTLYGGSTIGGISNKRSFCNTIRKTSTICSSVPTSAFVFTESSSHAATTTTNYGESSRHTSFSHQGGAAENYSRSALNVSSADQGASLPTGSSLFAKLATNSGMLRHR